VRSKRASANSETSSARREAEAAGRALESLEERLQDSVPRNEHERLIEAARSEQPQDQADAGELAELTRRLEQAEAARATAEGRISTLESERDAQERRAEVAQSDREANIRLFGTWFDGVVALFPGDLELAEVPEAGVLNVRLAWVTQSLRALVEARGDAVQTGLDAQEQLATLEAATSRAEFLEEEAAELQAKVQAASAEGDLGIRALAPLASALRAALESPETPAELLELIEEEGVESALVMLEGSAALVSNYLGRLVELSGEDEELLEPLGEVLAFIVDAVQFTYRIDWLRELSPDCQQLLCEQCSEGFRLVLLLLAVAGTKQFEFLFDVEFEAIHDSLKPSVLAGLVLYAEERRRDARGIGNRELAELWLRRRRKLCFASAALRSGSAHLEAEHLRLLPKTSLPQDDPHGWLLMSTLARSGEFTPCRRALDYMLLLPTALMREILLDAINLTEGEEARDRKISKAELSMLGYDPFYVLAFLEFSKENMRVLGLDVYQLQMLTRLSATSHLQGNSGERVAHNLEPVRFLVLSGLSALGGKSGLARTLIQRLGRESARLSSSLERQLGAYEVTLKRFG